jgi:hypothetical protein
MRLVEPVGASQTDNRQNRPRYAAVLANSANPLQRLPALQPTGLTERRA